MSKMTSEDIDRFSLDIRDRIFHAKKGKLLEIILPRGRWAMGATMEFALENGKPSSVTVDLRQGKKILASTREIRIYSWNAKHVDLEMIVNSDGKTPFRVKWNLGNRRLGTIRDIEIWGQRERSGEDGSE